MKRWGTRLHAALYRLTRGRSLGRVGRQSVLLLETAGRPAQRPAPDDAAAVPGLDRVARKAGRTLPVVVLTVPTR